MKDTKRELNLRASWASVIGILLPIHLLHRVFISVGASDLILAPAILVGVWRGEWQHCQELRDDPLTRWILGFAGSVVIGFFVGWLRLGHLIWWALVNRGMGLFLLLGMYCLFGLAAKSDVWFYLRCFVVAGSLLNLAALAAVVLRYAGNRGSIFFFGDTSLRLSGLMHNPNQYGGYLAALLAVQLTALVFAKSMFGRGWIDAANVVALLLGSLFTISRGSWLAALAAAVTVPVVSKAAGRFVPSRKLVAPVAVCFCFIAVLFVSHTGGMWPALRQNPPFHTSGDISSIYFTHSDPSFPEFLRVARDPAGAGDRLAIMRAALHLYAASPSAWALGVGLGGFSEMSPTTNLQTRVIIHNSFLWALVELGPVGAVCLIGIFQCSLRRLWRSLRSDAEDGAVSTALFVALISVLVWCLSNDGAYQRHLWFLLGLATATASASAGENGRVETSGNVSQRVTTA